MFIGALEYCVGVIQSGLRDSHHGGEEHTFRGEQLHLLRNFNSRVSSDQADRRCRKAFAGKRCAGDFNHFLSCAVVSKWPAARF